ncbi:hypothetical protein F9L07_22740 [Pimelobacter simplex]|uniref:Uncharacterized protein n=1 Tax=Nocardioides simplex TaxID=2045 RepID=A0A7J5DT96_NOCSI|nr:hypothetical protein [Pimelobacter simplex]KAB2808336.1 hypothetical protein F9L07_22740 [Pimelobacter simplex]
MTAASNSEARKCAAGIAASNPTAPEPTGTLKGAPGADSEALAARIADREALADLIPLGFDPIRDGVSNVYDAADLILASSWLADHDRQIVREHVTAALDEIEKRIEAWVRHGEAVPADVTTYDREIVHRELRALICDYRQEQDR